MRISDWSSDVCSSDLARRSHRMPRMTRIDFYILPEGGGPGGSPVMTACKLCDKATAGGHRVYAHVHDPVTAEDLDGALWSFQQGGFLAHERYDGEPLDEPLARKSTRLHPST